jgi:hypothetical protein
MASGKADATLPVIVRAAPVEICCEMTIRTSPKVNPRLAGDPSAASGRQLLSRAQHRVNISGVQQCPPSSKPIVSLLLDGFLLPCLLAVEWLLSLAIKIAALNRGIAVDYAGMA